MIVAFLLPQVEKAPVLERLLCPAQARAKAALVALQKRGQLTSKERGFRELEEITRQILLDETNSEPLLSMHLNRFSTASVASAAEAVGASGVTDRWKIQAQTDDATLSTKPSSVEKEIKATETARLRVIGFSLFLCGLALTTSTFFLQRSRSRSGEAIHPVAPG